MTLLHVFCIKQQKALAWLVGYYNHKIFFIMLITVFNYTHTVIDIFQFYIWLYSWYFCRGCLNYVSGARVKVNCIITSEGLGYKYNSHLELFIALYLSIFIFWFQPQ